MESYVNYYILLLVLSHFLFSGYSETNKEAHGHVTQVNLQRHEEKLLEFNAPISTTQRDITTPITTIPNLVPTTSTSPILNPNSNPDTYSPSSTVPITAPSTSNSPVSSGASWCIASPSASQRSLQVALDYACGYGATDCSAIQVGGSCYNPNSIHDHASFAFNKYYQKNPVPNSCNFGGSAVITNTNPRTKKVQLSDAEVKLFTTLLEAVSLNSLLYILSISGVGTCQYPSTSTSSSLLNTTNTSGANIFGYVPVPTNPSVSAAATTSNSFAQICFIIWAIAILQNKYIQHV